MNAIVFIGDSITASLPMSDLLAGFPVVNMGVHGDRTDLVLARIDNDVVSLRPSAVFILVGTNDLASGGGDVAILANYDAILGRLQTALPSAHIVVQSILPTRGLENRPPARIRRLNREIARLAECHRARFLDLAPDFEDSEGTMRIAFSDDGLHLTPAGNRRWAELLRPVLEELGRESD